MDIQEINRKRKEYAQKIIAMTGCSEVEAVGKLAHGRLLGISGETFIKYYGWELTDNELKELKTQVFAFREKQKRNRKWYINVIVERTGWDFDYAKEQMDKLEPRGYTYRKFVKEALYKLTEEERDALGPYVKPAPKVPMTREHILANRERTRSYRDAMKAEMGWNDGQLELAYLKCKTACGASFPEFYLFGLYKLPPEEGKKYITMEMHLKMQLRYCDYKGTQEYFENKTLFNTRFKDFVHRRWFSNADLTFEQFQKNVEGLTKIIYKPLEGVEGIGIEVYEINKSEEDNRRVYDEIMASGPANVEEFLVQHPALSEFWPNSVNTLRMMSICKDGKGQVLNAVIKFGTNANVDNYYQGGIAAGIELETGTICTDGVNNKGVLFETHPYSGKKFRGFQIPNWEKVKAACEKASCVVKEMPYVGWDIAINEHGEPEIIEGNHNQGAYLIQYSFAVSNREGRRPTIEPYLWFDEEH